MDTWQRRTAYYLLALGGIMLGYALLYHWAMATYEGIDRTFLKSLQIVVETFTTTGFGSDASTWDTWQTNLLVIVMDLTGVVLIFLALPVLLFPMFEETISTTPPTAVDGVENHVVICAYSTRIEMLIDELEVFDVSISMRVE